MNEPSKAQVVITIVILAVLIYVGYLVFSNGRHPAEDSPKPAPSVSVPTYPCTDQKCD